MILLVTGIQGSGKTQILANSKVKSNVIHLDNYIKTVLYNKEHYAHNIILEEFGKDVLDDDKNIDSKKLSKEVVANGEKGKAKLHKIITPYIKQYLRNLKDSVEKFFVDMTSYLNDERGFKFLFNKIVLVRNSNPEKRLKREVIPYVTDKADTDDIHYDELISYHGKIENAVKKFNKIADEFLKESNI